LRRYRPKLSMLQDKGVFHRDSLAKYTAAFLRNSLLGNWYTPFTRQPENPWVI
jgi:hypothetical protein